MTHFIHDKNTEKAINLAHQGKSFFITGKAGTGKTMLLRKIAKELQISKKVIICAPTGVAAKNAQGATLHSQFRIPITIYLPNHKVRNLYSLNADEEKIVKQINILIIDEVSMVRCDTMDMLNKILQHYRNNQQPFGGVQVIMFGDMRQLMPVVKDEDWEKLKRYYKAPYFFCSEVLSTISIPILELTKIHRQSDSKFISILNNLREGKLSASDEVTINRQYNPDFTPSDALKYIYLSTHRSRAEKINSEKLDLLKSKLFEFKAYVTDGFIPTKEAPADWKLELKCGARVMFITNDNTHNRYCNGTLGTIIHLFNNQIIVRTDDGKTIDVAPASWDFYKYVINKQTKEIERILMGRFHQYPLRLAWAITIHKSQGMTFDRVIIDVKKAFTYGQVYVALSRCRSLNGTILRTKISAACVKIDPLVTKFLQLNERIWSDDLLLDTETDDSMPNIEVPATLQQYNYSPIGTIFQIQGDDTYYDAWEDASQVFCIDKLIESDGQIKRLCVAQYEENSIMFDLIDRRLFHCIKSIDFLGGQCSYTSIEVDGVHSTFFYNGKKNNTTQHTKNSTRCEIWDKSPVLRSYTYEKKGDTLKIIKKSFQTSSPSEIKEYSDMGKLLLSCPLCQIIRNSNNHYDIGIHIRNQYQIHKFKLDGSALSITSQMLADQFYRNSSIKINDNFRHQPQQKKSVSQRKTPPPTPTETPKSQVSTKPQVIKPKLTIPQKACSVSMSQIEEAILTTLQKQGPMKAQTLALFLKKNKTEINSILYNTMRPKGIVTQTNYFWSSVDLE